jgi:GMP synthase-like glutamine amidotransferase
VTVPDPTTTGDPGDRVPTRLSVALLECDHVDAEVRDIAGDYGDMFLGLFAEHAPEVVFDRIDVVGGAPLPAFGAHDGIVITGSRQSVGDGSPWIDDLATLVVDAHEQDVPLVGICFGHQLIAHAMGGRVDRAPAGWGVGVHHATVAAPRAWMTPALRGFDLLVSHQDQVTGLPRGATVLATSDHAPVAAFEVGSLVGFQGHPEFVVDYADALMARRAGRIGAAAIERARGTLATPTDHGVVARWIGRYFRNARDEVPAH